MKKSLWLALALLSSSISLSLYAANAVTKQEEGEDDDSKFMENFTKMLEEIDFNEELDFGKDEEVTEVEATTGNVEALPADLETENSQKQSARF